MSDTRKFNRSIKVFLISIIVISAAGIICLSLAMMHSASKLGQEIAEQYFAAEEKNAKMYVDAVSLGRQYIDEMTENGAEPETVKKWMTGYFTKSIRSHNVNKYFYFVCYQGTIYADHYLDKEYRKNYENKKWFLESIKIDHGATLSLNSKGEEFNNLMGTIADINPKTGNGVAINLYEDDFWTIHSDWQYTLGENYYLTDEDGDLIYTSQHHRFDEAQKYVKGLQVKKKGVARNQQGRLALIYTYSSSNHWKAILTIPLVKLFGKAMIVTFIYTCIMAGFIWAIVIILRRSEAREVQNEQKKRIIDAITSIYCIGSYIDIEKDTYRLLMEPEGQYEDACEQTAASGFVNVLCENYVEKKYIENVKKFLSFETIGERLKNQPYVTYEYVSTVYGWVRIFLIPINRKPGEKVNEFLMLNHVIDEERVKELEKSVDEMTSLYEENEASLDEIRHLSEEQSTMLEEVRELNEKLEIAYQESEKANKAKSDFLSRMSHDIRTPMNVIVGMTGLALDKIEETEKVKGYLEKIEAEGAHLQNLINDILDISAIESGKLHVNRRESNVDAMLKRINDAVKSQVGARELDYTFTRGDIKYPILMMDKLRISQIYSNLLSNAIKYTPIGGKVNFDIWQEDDEREGWIILCARVKDTGIGMSESFMKNMYAEFVRGTDTRINKIQGSGLGLAIVKQLTDLMDGTVETKSQEKKGTEFLIKIPLQYVDKTQNQESSSVKKTTFAELKGKRILIAEDYDLNFEITNELLRVQGVETVRAIHGEEAVEQFKKSDENEFDAILMDIQMPVMDGMEATRVIRSMHRADAKTIPIIAMTANAFAEDANDCLEAGMNAHLAKPVDVTLMLQTLSSFLS